MSTELPATTPQPATDATNSEPARELKSRVAGKGDLLAIEALHDIAFGPGALTRTAYRVRERQPMCRRFAASSMMGPPWLRACGLRLCRSADVAAR